MYPFVTQYGRPTNTFIEIYAKIKQNLISISGMFLSNDLYSITTNFMQGSLKLYKVLDGRL